MILSAQITVILLHKLSLHNRKQPFPSHYWPLQHQYWPVWHHILLFWAAGPGVLNRLQKIAEGNLKPAIEAIWWHEAAGLFLKRVVIWSLLGGAGSRATGGFDRQAWKPIESLLLRQQTNQRPPISTMPPERLFVLDGPPASCVGALMAPKSGLLFAHTGSISLRYITASLAPKRGAETRTTKHISEKQGRV